MWSFPTASCLLRPTSNLSPRSVSLFSGVATVERAAGRFKYQRRLKSDLYHAESCYLYRLRRDLPVRYFQATPSLSNVLTEALTSFGTKAATAILTIPASTAPKKRANMHSSLDPPVRNFLILLFENYNRTYIDMIPFLAAMHRKVVRLDDKERPTRWYKSKRQ